MTGTTPFKGMYVPTVSGDRDVWGTLTNINWGLVDGYVGGFVVISVAGSGDYTVSSAEAANLNLVLTGILTGNRNFILPAICGNWQIKNGTSGAFTVTIKSATGGNSIELKQGGTMGVWSDATNIWPANGSTVGRLMSNGDATNLYESVVLNQFLGSIASNGWYQFPIPVGQTKPLTLNWGNQTFPTSATGVPIASAPYTQTFVKPYSTTPRVLCGGVATTSCYATGITTTGFTINSASFSASASGCWLAIGPGA